jgi:CheY-like chemotaxis protein
MQAEIVVVLNDTTLADLAAEALSALGHEAVAIHDPMAALGVLQEANSIDVLVASANFGKRKPNGPALARVTRANRPDLKALFIGPRDIIDIVGPHGASLPTPTTPMQIALTVMDMIEPR